jgi:hypothetical protein
MIFNSQSGIKDRTRETTGRSGTEHLRIMATVPGVFSAQRFTTMHRPSTFAGDVWRGVGGGV